MEQCASEHQGFAAARNRGSVAQMSRLHCDLLAWSLIKTNLDPSVFASLTHLFLFLDTFQ